MREEDRSHRYTISSRAVLLRGFFLGGVPKPQRELGQGKRKRVRPLLADQVVPLGAIDKVQKGVAISTTGREGRRATGRRASLSRQVGRRGQRPCNIPCFSPAKKKKKTSPVSDGDRDRRGLGMLRDRKLDADWFLFPGRTGQADGRKPVAFSVGMDNTDWR